MHVHEAYALLALLALAATAQQHTELNTTVDTKLDEESDSASFVVIVEHDDGRRCSGSLVTLRSAVTSRACSRGALRVLSPAARAQRRLARVAWPAGAEPRPAGAEPRPAGAEPRPGLWAAAALDLALLELEAPFDAGSGVRPIVMATHVDECSAPRACHAVHVEGAEHLRIEDAALVPAHACLERASAWHELRDMALCLAGPLLCSGDRGAGVVCDGKLCAVVARSADGAGRQAECGDVHAAQSVPRWRRFLHCANARGACGSAGSGECEKLCEERLLAPDGPTPTRTEPSLKPVAITTGIPVPTPQRTAAHGASTLRHDDTLYGANSLRHDDTLYGASTLRHDDTLYGASTLRHDDTLYGDSTTRHKDVADDASTWRHDDAAPTTGGSRVALAARTSPAPPARPLPSRTPHPIAEPEAPRAVLRASEFEPNRPDFKAGDYGDTAVEYVGDEVVLMSRAPPAPAAAQPPPPAAPVSATPLTAPPMRHKVAASRAPPLGASRCEYFFVLFLYLIL